MHRLLHEPGTPSPNSTTAVRTLPCALLPVAHLFSRCVCRSVVAKVRGSTMVAPAIQAAGSDSRVQSSACWWLEGRRGRGRGGGC